MRKPEKVERLYLDFDGYFASVEQFANPKLRGKPVGVVPFDGTTSTSVIACSREAKMQGVKSVMHMRDAKRVCPDIIFVPQKPDLYRKMHLMLLNEISTVIPIDTVKSIDELTCRLEPAMRDHPETIGYLLKKRLEGAVGKVITSSIGIAANRQLAKMACKAGKKHDGKSYGDGLAIWKPEDMPTPLLKLDLDDIPGVGSRMKFRLLKANIVNMELLLKCEPKHMRKLWRNVTGERLWYALHGYDIQAGESERGMFGHGRVLPPGSRSLSGAYEIARLLLVKAARRLRRENYYCSALWVSLSLEHGYWGRYFRLAVVNDDQAVLEGLSIVWRQAEKELHRHAKIFQVSVTLGNLSDADQRQLDMLLNDDRKRQKWEAANTAIDTLNKKYAGTVVTLGAWKPPEGGHTGGKISYTRIPSSEDFWV
ncbi:Y-family DNA polymerase [Bartonella choladocola]|nr:type VI secretion protein ImpB [Bartonella choladocola]